MAARKPRAHTTKPATPKKAKPSKAKTAKAVKGAEAPKARSAKVKAAAPSKPKKAAPAKAKAAPAKAKKAAPAKVKAAPAKVKAAPAKVKAAPAKRMTSPDARTKADGVPVAALRAKGKGRVFDDNADVKILVVDDEPEVLELLVPYLKKQGYTVSEAQDGDQALEKILTERPNIVVLDVMMPGLSGWEISRYVREREELAPVRIIMATGIGKDTNAATSPLYGADASIDKPFRLDALHQLVRDVIARIEAGLI
ncbi:response regulator [Myxococcota bacterium]|nr:response regulator [Myxococcota bacterium]